MNARNGVKNTYRPFRRLALTQHNTTHSQSSPAQSIQSVTLNPRMRFHTSGSGDRLWEQDDPPNLNLKMQSSHPCPVLLDQGLLLMRGEDGTPDPVPIRLWAQPLACTNKLSTTLVHRT